MNDKIYLKVWTCVHVRHDWFLGGGRIDLQFCTHSIQTIQVCLKESSEDRKQKTNEDAIDIFCRLSSSQYVCFHPSNCKGSGIQDSTLNFARHQFSSCNSSIFFFDFFLSDLTRRNPKPQPFKPNITESEKTQECNSSRSTREPLFLQAWFWTSFTISLFFFWMKWTLAVRLTLISGQEL